MNTDTKHEDDRIDPWIANQVRQVIKVIGFRRLRRLIDLFEQEETKQKE